MPRSGRYSKRIDLTVTEAMYADLKAASTETQSPITAIVRQAIHNYLGNAGLVPGSQQELEDWLIVLAFIISSEFARSHDDMQARQLFDNAVKNFPRYAEAIRAAFKQREGEERSEKSEEES